jgi:hypothetical protein
MKSEESSKIKYIKFEDSIVINFGNVNSIIGRTDPRFKSILAAIENNELHKIPNILNPEDLAEIKKLLKLK